LNLLLAAFLLFQYSFLRFLLLCQFLLPCCQYVKTFFKFWCLDSFWVEKRSYLLVLG
jgi:hypothetical protein